MSSTHYFTVALCSNEPDAMPHFEFCEQDHSTAQAARECWYKHPPEFRATVQAWCREFNCRVVVWENEVIDRLHSIADA